MTSPVPTILYQSYPPPTRLPAMREGETDGRYMDCSPALAPVGDAFIDISSVTTTVVRLDGVATTSADLRPVGGTWPPVLDATGQVVTYGWIAPIGSGSVTYFLTIQGSTREGRTFVRDWIMSVLPLMG